MTNVIGYYDNCHFLHFSLAISNYQLRIKSKSKIYIRVITYTEILALLSVMLTSPAYIASAGGYINLMIINMRKYSPTDRDIEYFSSTNGSSDRSSGCADYISNNSTRAAYSLIQKRFRILFLSIFRI